MCSKLEKIWNLSEYWKAACLCIISNIKCVQALHESLHTEQKRGQILLLYFGTFDAHPSINVVSILYMYQCVGGTMCMLSISLSIHTSLPIPAKWVSIRSVRLEISFRTAFYAKIISICSGAMVVVRNIRCSIPYLTYVIRTTSFNECNKKNKYLRICV